MTLNVIRSILFVFILVYAFAENALAAPDIKIQNAKFKSSTGVLEVRGKLSGFDEAEDVGLIGYGPGWIENLGAVEDINKHFLFRIDLEDATPPCSVRVEAGGFSEVANVKRGSSNCDPLTLRLEGLVTDDPIPFATVTVTVGGVSYTTVADENGAYTIDIASILFEELVLIEADFADDTDADLISLGSFSKYLETSDNGLVTEGTNVTNVTSAMFLAVVEANGGTPPTTVEELIDAETHVDVTDVLNTAAVIKMILDADVSVPPGCMGLPLLDCVSAPGVVDAVISDNPAVFDDVVGEILANNALVPGFSNLPSRYYAVRTSYPGFLSRVGELMDFGVNDGVLYTSTNRALPAAVEFNWSIDLGVLVLDFPDYPVIRFPISLDFLASQHPGATMDDGGPLGDNGVRDCTIDSIANANFPEHRVLELQRRLTRISQGVSIDTASVEKRIEMRDFDSVECSDGIFRTPQPIFDFAYEDQLLQENTSVNGQPFTADLAEGSWAATFYYDTEIFGVVERRFAGDVVTFNMDGTVAADSSNSSAWSWAESGDDILLDYGDGWTQRMSIVNSLDPDGATGDVVEYQIFSVFEGPGPDDRLATLDIAIEVDNSLTLSETNLVNDPDYFWSGMVNSWQPSYWDGGELLISTYFGWRIRPAEAGGQVFYAPFLSCGPGSTGDPAWWVRPFGDGGAPAMGWTVDGNGNLNMPYRNGFRERSWVPLQETVGLDGQRILYVFESERQLGLTRFPPRMNIQWELPEPTDTLCEVEF